MRKLFVPLLAAALLPGAAAPAAAATRKITVGDNFFVRDSGVPRVSVARKTRVEWVWKGRSLHDVKVVKGPVRFGSPRKSSGTYAKRLRRAGTYTIVCTVHGPADQRMKLVVR